jgi:hypothetical protein
MHVEIWSENLQGKGHLGDLGVNRRIVLTLMLKKQGRRAWTGLIWLRSGTKIDSCEEK